MAQVLIGFQISDAFAEISVFDSPQASNPSSKPLFSARSSLAKKSWHEWLKEIFSENPSWKGAHLCVSTQLGRTLVNRRAGSSVGLIVTAGFEHWPRLRQPLLTRELSIRPHKKKPLLSQDFIFGFSERTNSRGEVELEPQLEEMEFLVPKLELAEVKSLAVGFLHSSLNPHNEKKVAEFFRSKNFSVICSHEIPESHNEVARWWRAVLNTYLVESFQDWEEKWKDLQEEYDLNVQVLSSDGHFFFKDSSQYFPSCFGHLKALAQYTKTKKFQHGIYFGIEDFYLVHSSRVEKVFEGDFGPVALSVPAHKRLKIQPTLIVDPESLNTLFADRKESSFEPGPMLLGRALRPTFIDVLLLKSNIQDCFDIKEPELVKKKISDTVRTLYKGRFQDQPNIENYLEDICIKSLAQELTLSNIQDPILCFGPLASYLIPQLTKHSPWLKLQLDKDANFSCSKALAEMPVKLAHSQEARA